MRTGSGGGLAPFAFQAETTALTAAFTTPPTARRKMTIDTAIKRLKDAGVWSKLAGLWVFGQDEQSSLLNWVNPAVPATKVGTPTFTANFGYKPAANGDYINTNININTLTPAQCGIFAYTEKPATDLVLADMGGVDVSGNGLSFTLFNTSTSTPTGRCGGSNFVSVIGSSSLWLGKSRFQMLTRESSTQFSAWRGPLKVATVSSTASASLGSANITLMALNNNGTIGAASVQRQFQLAGVLNGTLTQAQGETLANVCQALVYQLQWGEFDLNPPGCLPATVTADLVIYGLTSQGLVAAYEAKRQGLSVALVGGWRDTEANIGGMSAGGLGSADFNAPTGLGGLPRWIMSQMQTIQSKTSTDFKFAPAVFNQVTRGMFDPRIANGLDIPIYLSTGVTSVTTAAARITSFATGDGRSFSGTYFIDASYEGDLMKKSGIISTRIGRESSAEFGESLAGFLGSSSNNMWKNAAGTSVNIDPYNTPGTPASGLLPFLTGTFPATANGTADTQVQAYNFRLTLVSNSAWRMPFPSTPPAGYNAANYEGLLRLLAASPTFTRTTLFNSNALNTSNFSDATDFNNGPGTNMDLVGNGLSSAYPGADYATRETTYQAHVNHILGMFYTLQYLADARVPSALRTEMLTWGFDMRHYPIQKSGDAISNFSPQLYVREAWRLDNDFMLRQSDLTATDGTTPRSTKTIATISYAMDSHSVGVYADTTAGRIANEGEMGAGSGGVNLICPVPYEVITPRKAECENCAVVFGVAATHVAFGAYRMEFTSMQAAQSAAIAIKIAKTASNQALQDVDYPTLRTALLASNALSGETAPVLPQVN